MALESAIIDLLASWNIEAVAKREAPGVYVNGRKVASIGLRIRRGSSYHGLAFNVAMDLQPFQRINPCGYRGLEVTDLRSLGVNASVQEVADGVVTATACIVAADAGRGCQLMFHAPGIHMRAVVLSSYGPPPDLSVKDIPAPALKPGARSYTRARGGLWFSRRVDGRGQISGQAGSALYTGE